LSCPERARCSRCCQPPHPTISSDGMHRRLCYGFLVGVHNPHSKPEVQVAHASAVLIDLLLILPYLMYGVGCKATLTFILPYFLVIPIPGSILPHCYLLTKSGEAPPPICGSIVPHCYMLTLDFGGYVCWSPYSGSLLSHTSSTWFGLQWLCWSLGQLSNVSATTSEACSFPLTFFINQGFTRWYLPNLHKSFMPILCNLCTDFLNQTCH